MNSFARPAIVIYALLLFVGGIIGFVAAGSKMSLLTSTISALLLAAAFVMTAKQPKQGFALATGIAVLLAFFFAYRVIKTGKPMPAGGVCGLSLLAAGVFGTASRRTLS